MIRFFLINVLLLSLTLTNAQNSSVYSRFGIGDLEYGYSSRMLGIGDLGIAELDAEHILISNPAGWSALNRTRIEIGLGYKGVLISDNSRSAFTSEVEFTGLTFGFPVSRDLGIGLVAGIVPYSNLSYKVKSKVEATEEIPAYTNTYDGKGGLSKIFIGSSYQMPLDFIIGASLDYYFGNQNYLLARDFENSDGYVNSVFENSHRSTGTGVSLGIISPNLAKNFGLDFFSDLRIGVSYNLTGKLNTDTIYTSTSNYLVDTTASGNAETEIPARFNGGISFGLSDEYNFNVDYMFQQFSSFTFNGAKNSNLQDASKFSAAFEYKPKRALGQTSWEQIVWRFGLSFEQTQYKFNGNGINQFSTFAGLSFPLGIDNTIDLAVEYSNRGKTDNNLINEQAIKIYLGLSFGELWFLRFDK
jgi:hypothetical protein